jgi:hypothetical protein
MIDEIAHEESLWKEMYEMPTRFLKWLLRTHWSGRRSVYGMEASVIMMQCRAVGDTQRLPPRKSRRVCPALSTH